MIRVVFDTVVFVRSLLSPYGWWGRLVFDYADRYQLVLSEPVIREILEVLHGPELSEKYRTVATRNVAAILELLGSAEVIPLTVIPSISFSRSKGRQIPGNGCGGGSRVCRER